MINKSLKIFVKNPEIGKVKTRLAATVGDQEALKIYHHLLSYTQKVVLKVDTKKEVWYSKYVDETDLWAGELFIKKEQRGKHLGIRMKTAFQDSFLEDKHAQVVLIGSDCAELESCHINKAFEKLKSNDIVIGPAKDGGYYLIGMSKFLPSVFDDINWSTAEVLTQTIEKINTLNSSYYLLETLSDIDHFEDWEKIKDRVLSND